jgi:hypothetical protein
VEYVQRTLEELGIEPARVRMFNLSSAMGLRFAEIAREMTEFESSDRVRFNPIQRPIKINYTTKPKEVNNDSSRSKISG